MEIDTTTEFTDVSDLRKALGLYNAAELDGVPAEERSKIPLRMSVTVASLEEYLRENKGYEETLQIVASLNRLGIMWTINSGNLEWIVAESRLPELATALGDLRSRVYHVACWTLEAEARLRKNGWSASVDRRIVSDEEKSVARLCPS